MENHYFKQLHQDLILLRQARMEQAQMKVEGENDKAEDAEMVKKLVKNVRSSMWFIMASPTRPSQPLGCGMMPGYGVITANARQPVRDLYNKLQELKSTGVEPSKEATKVVQDLLHTLNLQLRNDQLKEPQLKGVDQSKKPAPVDKHARLARNENLKRYCMQLAYDNYMDMVNEDGDEDDAGEVINEQLYG